MNKIINDIHQKKNKLSIKIGELKENQTIFGEWLDELDDLQRKKELIPQSNEDQPKRQRVLHTVEHEGPDAPPKEQNLVKIREKREKDRDKRLHFLRQNS